MLKRTLIIFLSSLILSSAVAQSPQDPSGIARLIAAYPDALVESSKPNVVRWKDGTEMAYDDGVRRTTLEERLAHGSLRDQMAIPYPRGWPIPAPDMDSDPGRVRHEPFFRKLYGDSADEVARSLIPVSWPPAGSKKTIAFTCLHGAARALENAARELDALPKQVKQYVARPIGSFVWRNQDGETRLSPHSFSIAVDFQLPRNLYRYWRWDAKAPFAYPREVLADANLGRIVKIFERHGFIWGGKWHHYDTMHFEYRPELAKPERPGKENLP